MITRIGLSNGVTYESDFTPDSEVLDELRETNGAIFTGSLSNRRINTLEEFVDFFSTIPFSGVDGEKLTTFGMVINGIKRQFRAEAILWCEMELEK